MHGGLNRVYRDLHNLCNCVTLIVTHFLIEFFKDRKSALFAKVQIIENSTKQEGEKCILPRYSFMSVLFVAHSHPDFIHTVRGSHI